MNRGTGYNQNLFDIIKNKPWDHVKGIDISQHKFWQEVNNLDSFQKYHPYYLLSARYYGDGSVRKTYREVGEQFNVSRERARQYILKIIRLMLHPTRVGRYKR